MSNQKVYFHQRWAGDGTLTIAFTQYGEADPRPEGLITSVDDPDRRTYAKHLTGLEPPPATVLGFVSRTARAHPAFIFALDQRVKVLKAELAKAARAQASDAADAGSAAAGSFFAQGLDTPGGDNPPNPRAKPDGFEK